MIRTPEALIPYVLALAALLGGMLWHLGDSVNGLGRTVVTGAPSIGGAFELVDQAGQIESEKNFRGHWMLVYFGYTHCPDVCPITLSLMADVRQRLGAQAAHVVPVFITIDPDRDDVKTMKQYVAAFGKDFVGLTGSGKQIANVAREYRVYYRKRPTTVGDYAMDHSGQIYLMNAEGKFAATYDDSQKPESIAADIRARL